jgi:hypothetical protein
MRNTDLTIMFDPGELEDPLYLGSLNPVHFSQIPNTPDSSQAISLPYVQQNAPTATSTLAPEDPGYLPPHPATEIIPGTPSPTPIPIQTGAFNVPIVIGVGVIIAIILISWGVVGRFKH